MLKLNFNLSSIYLFSVVALLCSCSSGQKYSYNFSRYDYQQKAGIAHEEVENSIVESTPVLSASTAQTGLDNMDTEVLKPVLETPKVSPVASAQQRDKTKTKALPNGIPLKKTKAYTKLEKKAIRKDFRSEKKVYKKAKKAGDTAMMAESAERLTGYTRSGVIIGAAGLILIIIGSVSIGVLVAIGAIALVTGLVLIVIDNA